MWKDHGREQSLAAALQGTCIKGKPFLRPLGYICTTEELYIRALIHIHSTASSSPGRSLSFFPGYGISLCWLGEVVTCHCGQCRYASLLFLRTSFTLLSQETNELRFLLFCIFFLYSLSLCLVPSAPVLSAVPQGRLQCAVLSTFLSKSMNFPWMRDKH